jgi:rhamnulokinase
MEELEETKVEVVHIVGGGTKNELLNQFTANACGCSVVAGPDEGTGIGNILIQARTAGEIGSLDDIRQVVRASSQLKDYEPADGDAWDAAAAKLDEFRSQLSK